MLLPRMELLFNMPHEFEWLIIILVVIVLFGGKKIPELAKGLGKGIREFKDAKAGIKEEIEKGITEEPKARQTAAPKAISQNGGSQEIPTEIHIEEAKPEQK